VNNILLIFMIVFLGLVAVVAALALLLTETREQVHGWSTRSRLASLCFLGAGIGLVGGSAYKLTRWSILQGGNTFSQSPRFTILVLGSALVLVVGLILRAAGGRVNQSGFVWGRGVLGMSLVVSLILTLVGLASIQLLGVSVSDRSWIVREIPATEFAVAREAPPQAAYGTKYELSEDRDWFSRVRPIWEVALARYRGRPNVSYLEIGLFEGRSALWMLDNILTDPTATLTGIDPFSDPHYVSGKAVRTYKDIFYSNLAISGLAQKARIIEGFSQIELRKLPLGSFDIIYIDGSHSSSDVLEDGILCWRLLKDDGLMIFDDYQLHPGLKRAVDMFYANFAEEFSPMHVGWQVILKKKPRDRSVPGDWR
jgi:hypothetical protein